MHHKYLQVRWKWLKIDSSLRTCRSILIAYKWKDLEQECIPVGSVPAERWPYSGACCSGGIWSWGGWVVSAPGGGGVWSRGDGGVCSQGDLVPGGCLVRGVSAPPGGCLLPGGVCSRGVSAPGGWSSTPPLGPGRYPCPPPWTEWMTDRCKNITLAKTSFRPVIKDRNNYLSQPL